MMATAHAPPRDVDSEHRLHLVQGEFLVSDNAGAVLTTTLGSCVSTCLYDPFARVGGMNHFLLPHGEAFEGPDAIRYGAHAMELLINGMLHAGARKDRLVAKLFGGARMSASLPDVGGANTAFAEHFLRHEGITYLGGSTRGQVARRIEFWPVNGRARQRTISGDGFDVVRAERPAAAPSYDDGSVEFFGD